MAGRMYTSAMSIQLTYSPGGFGSTRKGKCRAYRQYVRVQQLMGDIAASIDGNGQSTSICVDQRGICLKLRTDDRLRRGKTG